MVRPTKPTTVDWCKVCLSVRPRRVPLREWVCCDRPERRSKRLVSRTAADRFVSGRLGPVLHARKSVREQGGWMVGDVAPDRWREACG